MKFATETAIVTIGAGILAAALVALALCGCKTDTREQIDTEKRDRITINGTLTMPTADGPKAVPVAMTIDRTGTEEARKTGTTTTGVDGAAIGREIAAAIVPALTAASGGLPWASILSGVGAAATAAGTGFLALKKHQQMRAPSRKEQSHG